jgi:hypothetical protein
VRLLHFHSPLGECFAPIEDSVEEAGEFGCELDHSSNSAETCAALRSSPPEPEWVSPALPAYVRPMGRVSTGPSVRAQVHPGPPERPGPERHEPDRHVPDRHLVRSPHFDRVSVAGASSPNLLPRFSSPSALPLRRRAPAGGRGPSLFGGPVGVGPWIGPGGCPLIPGARPIRRPGLAREEHHPGPPERPLRAHSVVVNWRCWRDAGVSHPEASHNSQQALSACRSHPASCLLALVQRTEPSLTHSRWHCLDFPRRTCE